MLPNTPIGRREFIRYASLLEHFGLQGPPAKHRVLHQVNAWSAGEEPQLERVRPEGEPIFGDLS